MPKPVTLGPMTPAQLWVDEAWPSLVVNTASGTGWRIPEDLLQKYQGLLVDLEAVEKEIVKAAIDDGMPEYQVQAVLEEWEHK
jgi:hypothetical protein